MQVGIISGTTVRNGEFVTSYPVNLDTKIIDSGVSKGQLVTSRGARKIGNGPGVDRGSIVWKGAHYRVMADKLVSVDSGGEATILADVGYDGAPVGLDYGFDLLAIRSAGRLFYWDGSQRIEVNDPDIGVVNDVMWIDGYYATTDGTYVIVTDINDPTSINPTRYGSAESDPDPITGLIKYRGEMCAIGRNTLTFMQNVGGNGFPFQVAQGATEQCGAISATAKCTVGGSGFAFVGSPRGEPLAVYFYNGSVNRISDTEIDDLIAAEPNPEAIEMECRAYSAERQIIIHLSSCSLCLSVSTTDAAGQGAWTILHSGHFEPYRLRHAALYNGKHYVGDVSGSNIGVVEGDPRHFGEGTDWRFDASIMFDPGGMQVSQVQLFGQFPTEQNAVFCSITRDGVGWSREASRRLTGRRDEPVLWSPNCPFYSTGSFRFRGRGRVAIARCEVT